MHQPRPPYGPGGEGDRVWGRSPCVLLCDPRTGLALVSLHTEVAPFPHLLWFWQEPDRQMSSPHVGGKVGIRYMQGPLSMHAPSLSVDFKDLGMLQFTADVKPPLSSWEDPPPCGWQQWPPCWLAWWDFLTGCPAQRESGSLLFLGLCDSDCYGS